METLRGKLLVAAPDMQDSIFQRALILVCEHDAEHGAMGVIVNHPSEMTLRDLLEDLNIKPRVEQGLARPIFLGGPVQPSLGFGLYAGALDLVDSLAIDKDLKITASRDLLEKCAVGKGPKSLLLIMGYAGWSPGQLERELEVGAWWLAAPSPALVFESPPAQRWGEAVRQLGLDESALYHGSGHA